MRQTFPLLALCLVACAHTTAPDAPAILPLKTVRLYETGVGYFERSGRLTEDTRTVLPVPAGHLDDALKTLVVLGPQGASSVHGLEFGSSVSKGMARALAGLPKDGESPMTFDTMLASLKGATVEVRTHGASTTGRIVDVIVPEKPDPAKTDPPAPSVLVVFTDHSEIVRFKTTDLEAVRPIDTTNVARIGAALDALSPQSAQGRRKIELAADAKTPITLGYVAEAPIWRTTYRLVLDPRGTSGVLQGWALVHNDTDEEWHGVKVELVNGRPDSFLYPLAVPRYGRRELVHPESDLSAVPQLLDTTADALWGDHLDDTVGVGGLGLSGIGAGGSGSGYGSGHGSISGSHRTIAAVTVGSSPMLEVGNLAAVAQATGAEAGALFRYTVAAPLDLGAHGSALVPLVQQSVGAEAIAWFDGETEPARSAVRFVNGTAQTLPPGPIAFFADGGFAGESAIDRLKPGERRFLKYGADLDVELQAAKPRVVEEPKRLVFEDGTLVEHFLRTTDSAYTFENRSGTPRSIYLEIDRDQNAIVKGPDRIDFDEATSKPVVVFLVAARTKVERRASSVEGLSRRMPLATLTTKRLTELGAVASLPAAERAAAAEAALRQKEVEDGRAAIEKSKKDLAEGEADLARLREDLKAAGDKSTGPNPVVTRVLTAEDRLIAARKRVATLEAEGTTRQNAVRAVLAKLAR